jgi:hypothetical protein
MGAFAHLLNIRPWEWPQLTYAEVQALIRYVDDATGER